MYKITTFDVFSISKCQKLLLYCIEKIDFLLDISVFLMTFSYTITSNFITYKITNTNK